MTTTPRKKRPTTTSQEDISSPGYPHPVDHSHLQPVSPLALPRNEKPKRSKYNNKPVIIDGKRFMSTAEGNRFIVLRTEQEQGLIHDLQCQVHFKLYADKNGDKVYLWTYVADFTYYRHTPNGDVFTVEDFKAGDNKKMANGKKNKGTRTPVYRHNKILMKVCYDITILETHA